MTVSTEDHQRTVTLTLSIDTETYDPLLAEWAKNLPKSPDNMVKRKPTEPYYLRHNHWGKRL